MAATDRPSPIAVPEFAEQHLGEWQGLERKPFYAERKVGTHTLWFAPAHERAPGGESFVDLVERVRAPIDKFTAEHRGRDIVAVTHGGTIRAALTLALRLDPQAALSFVVENCSLTRLDFIDPRARRACGASAPSTTAPGASSGKPSATSGVLG